MLKYLLAICLIFIAAAVCAEPPQENFLLAEPEQFVSIGGPDSLGYGAPITKAPVPDRVRTASKVFEGATLVSLRNDPNDMMALNGYGQENTAIVRSSAGVPRVYAPLPIEAAAGCSGYGCSGSVQSYSSCSGSGCSGSQGRFGGPVRRLFRRR